MKVVGIDPGKSGAIAVVEDRVLMDITHMPVTGQTKKALDVNAIIDFIDTHKPNAVYIENVHAMPGQGVTSMFNFGLGYGMLLGIVMTMRIPLYEVSPQKWMQHFGIYGKGDKKEAIANKLIKQYPGMWYKLPRGGINFGKTDAVGIATYGYNDIMKLVKEIV